MAESSFLPVLQVACFLLAVWVVSGIARALKGSQLVGELLVGVILGPQVLDIVPHPDALKLLGEIGVILMVTEAGLQFDARGAAKIGGRALAIGVVAALAPIGLGSLVVYLLGWDYYPIAIAAGVSICPTSVGMASKLLLEAQILRSELGRLLVCAAFLTDVVALTCVALFERVSSSHSGIESVLLPLLYTLLFLVIGATFSIFVIPKVLKHVVIRIPDYQYGKGRTLRHDILLFSCVGSSLLYAYVGSLYASLLLGAFMAGMAFHSATETLEAWTRQIKRFRQWFVKIFFAATIGFVLPVGSMMHGIAFAKGLALFAAAVLGKLLGGLLAPPGTDKLSVGLSISGRGEFAYAVANQLAQSAEGDPLIPADAYAVVVWGLVLTTFLVPFAFRYRLSRIQPPSSPIHEHSAFRRADASSGPPPDSAMPKPLHAEPSLVAGEDAYWDAPAGADGTVASVAKPQAKRIPDLIAGEDAYWDSPALPAASDPELASAECVPELALTVTSVDPEEDSTNHQQ